MTLLRHNLILGLRRCHVTLSAPHGPRNTSPTGAFTASRKAVPRFPLDDVTVALTLPAMTLLAARQHGSMQQMPVLFQVALQLCSPWKAPAASCRDAMTMATFAFPRALHSLDGDVRIPSHFPPGSQLPHHNALALAMSFVATWKTAFDVWVKWDAKRNGRRCVPGSIVSVARPFNNERWQTLVCR